MELETGFSLYVSDFDMVSLYPSIMVALNSSRMTLTFVPYEIEGFDSSDIQWYFANLVYVRENAESLCSNFHSLPNYRTMFERIKQALS